MRHLIFLNQIICLFFFGSFIVSGQNIILSPAIKKINNFADFQTKITKIENGKEYTAIYLEVMNTLYYSNSIWFDSINRYKLVDVVTGNTYKLLNDLPTKANPVKISDRATFVFWLKFEKIPPEVHTVNLIQGNRSNGWNILGIDTDFAKYFQESIRNITYTGIVFDKELRSVGIIHIQLSNGSYTVKMFEDTDVYYKTNKKGFFKNKQDLWAISINEYKDEDDKIIDIEGTILRNNWGYSTSYWFVGFEGTKKQLLNKKKGIIYLEKQKTNSIASVELKTYNGNNKYIKKGTNLICINSLSQEDNYETAITYINYDFEKHSYSIQGLTKVVGKAKNGEYSGPVILYHLFSYSDEPATPFYYIGNFKGMFFENGVVRSYNLKNEQTEECICNNEILNCKALKSTIAQQKFAEFLGAATIAVAGTAKLLELAISTTGSSDASNLPSKQSVDAKSLYEIIYTSKRTKSEVNFIESGKKYVTISIVTEGKANDQTYYFSSVTIKKKDGRIIEKGTCDDPYKDNGLANKYSIFTFDQSLGDYIEVEVRYGHKEYNLFGKDNYLGIGSIIRLKNNSGDYEIKVLPK